MDKKKEILEAFNFRFACKKFDETKKISESDFNFILETGRLSPSSFGFEPWKFLVIENEELKDKLKEVSWGAQGQLSTASHFVLILARKSPSYLKGSDHLKYIMDEVKGLPEDIKKAYSNFFEEFKVNNFDLTDDRKIFDWSCKQTYIALANMITSAAQIKIDSCPIEGFDREKVENILNKENIIDTNEFGLSVMVAFGYRSLDQSLRSKTRSDKERIIQIVK